MQAGAQNPGQAARPETPGTLSEVRRNAFRSGREAAKLDARVERVGPLSAELVVTPFSSYDAALVTAVRQRWCDLLDSAPLVQAGGKVVLEFQLNQDGRVTELKVKENQADAILAFMGERAVRDPSPFARWPDDMRRAIAKNFRDVTITFDYTPVAAPP